MPTPLIKQIHTIVNDAFHDAIGDNAGATTIDTSDFVSMGRALGDGQTIDSVKMYEAYFASLANRIVKTVYAVRAYSASRRGILRDETEWGAFKQKVHYDVVDAVENPAFNIPDRSGATPDYEQASPYDVSTTINIKSLLFGGQGTWSIEIQRPVAQIMTAFTGAAEMTSFIDGIYVYVENSMQMQIEGIENAAANTAMAYAMQAGLARNLLAEYNALDSTTTKVRAADCLANPGFQRYMAKEIRQTTKYMRKMSRRFNGGGMPKFTPEEDLVLEILETVVSASEVYMQSDTYHRELVELPRFTPVEFWQTSGQDFSFEDVSSFAIQNDEFVNSSNSTGVVKGSGIVAFLHDVDAVAANFGEFYDWEQPNVRARVMNIGRQARKGYAVDPNENMFVFFVADSDDIEDVTLAADAQGNTQYGVNVSTIQGSDLAVSVNPIAGNAITGTSKWMAAGNAITDVWGAGNFIALAFTSDDWTQYDSVKVGLSPSAGSGLVEIIGEDDKTGVFKISDKSKQTFKIVTRKGFLTEVQTYSLSGLTLQSAG